MEGRKKVLVAEDDPATRKMIQIVLERFGYDVVPIPDGEAAVTACTESVPDLPFEIEALVAAVEKCLEKKAA